MSPFGAVISTWRVAAICPSTRTVRRALAHRMVAAKVEDDLGTIAIGGSGRGADARHVGSRRGLRPGAGEGAAISWRLHANRPERYTEVRRASCHRLPKSVVDSRVALQGCEVGSLPSPPQQQRRCSRRRPIATPRSVRSLVCSLPTLTILAPASRLAHRPTTMIKPLRNLLTGIFAAIPEPIDYAARAAFQSHSALKRARARARAQNRRMAIASRQWRVAASGERNCIISAWTASSQRASDTPKAKLTA